jgi:alkanesulfonate monooxygenase SsuD/methylene tetrahydromethanopterin reductase-like flavin-dependent oxidoreductase (luciferase family)
VVTERRSLVLPPEQAAGLELRYDLVDEVGEGAGKIARQDVEPITLISALSASTRHIGLGATVSTSFGEPYHVARTFASIVAPPRGVVAGATW